jgi:hypothetical protein
VTGDGVSGNDMPSLPWTARQHGSPVEDASLAAWLAGSGPADASAEPGLVADVLAALTARPAGDELTGLAAAQAEFRRHIVRPLRVRQSPRPRPGGLTSRLFVKVGAAAAVVALGLVGAAAAAYAGALPGAWQRVAHRMIAAPAHAAGHDTRAGPGAAGPGAAGRAARRPCAAYRRAPTHDAADQPAAAGRHPGRAGGGRRSRPGGRPHCTRVSPAHRKHSGPPAGPGPRMTPGHRATQDRPPRGRPHTAASRRTSLGHANALGRPARDRSGRRR